MVVELVALGLGASSLSLLWFGVWSKPSRDWDCARKREASGAEDGCQSRERLLVLATAGHGEDPGVARRAACETGVPAGVIRCREYLQRWILGREGA